VTPFVSKKVLNVPPDTNGLASAFCDAALALVFSIACDQQLRGYYNAKFVALVEPSIDPQVLGRALDRVAARHAMLRARFAADRWRGHAMRRNGDIGSRVCVRGGQHR